MITRQQVANKAGVSPSTVSRVVNENGYVAPDVRDRVLRAISELEYVPNHIARSLRTKESKHFACITHNISNPFYSEIVVGIEEVTYQKGYALSLYSAHFADSDYPRSISERLYDGMIVLSPEELYKSSLLQRLTQTVPTVLYWDFGGDAPVPNVTVNLRAGMREIVDTLAHYGHRRIAFLGHGATNGDANPRYHGFQEGIAAHAGLQAPVVLTVPSWGDSLEYGYDTVKQHLRETYTLAFTAIAAANDLLAIGAMRALQEAGLQVPQDVSIIGMDDLEVSQYVTPALTTMRIPKRDIGRTLGEMMFHALQGNLQPAQRRILPTDLIVRQSLARIPG